MPPAWQPPTADTRREVMYQASHAQFLVLRGRAMNLNVMDAATLPPFGRRSHNLVVVIAQGDIFSYVVDAFVFHTNVHGDRTSHDARINDLGVRTLYVIARRKVQHGSQQASALPPVKCMLPLADCKGKAICMCMLLFMALSQSGGITPWCQPRNFLGPLMTSMEFSGMFTTLLTTHAEWLKHAIAPTSQYR